MTTFYVRDSSGFREANSDDVISQANALIGRRFRVGSPVIGTPARTREFLKLRLGALEHEVFGVLHLDARMRLIAAENLFRGTTSCAHVHTREVMKSALLHGASGLIAYHNHPSGVIEPSPADEYITRQLKDGLSLIDVRLIDHLIVGEGVYSFSEHGLI